MQDEDDFLVAWLYEEVQESLTGLSANSMFLAESAVQDAFPTEELKMRIKKSYSAKRKVYHSILQNMSFSVILSLGLRKIQFLSSCYLRNACFLSVQLVRQLHRHQWFRRSTKLQILCSQVLRPPPEPVLYPTIKTRKNHSHFPHLSPKLKCSVFRLMTILKTWGNHHAQRCARPQIERSQCLFQNT